MTFTRLQNTYFHVGILQVPEGSSPPFSLYAHKMETVAGNSAVQSQNLQYMLTLQVNRYDIVALLMKSQGLIQTQLICIRRNKIHLTPVHIPDCYQLQ